jgi:hypothetical protein
MSYTKLQFIAYSICTGPQNVSTTSNKQKYLGLPTSLPDLKKRNADTPISIDAAIERGIPIAAIDIAERIKLVKSVLEQAAQEVTNSGSDKDDILKLFMMPEFFFRGEHGAYSMPDYDLVVTSLQELVKEELKWKNWIFVFGSIISMPNPTKPIDEQEVYNTVLVQKGGFSGSTLLQPASDNAKIVMKEFKSGIDFIQQANRTQFNSHPSINKGVYWERVFHPLTENQYRLEKLLRRMIAAQDSDLTQVPISFSPSEIKLWKQEKGGLVNQLNSLSEKEILLQKLRNTSLRSSTPLYKLIEKYLLNQDLLSESLFQTERYLRAMLSDTGLDSGLLAYLKKQLNDGRYKKILLEDLRSPTKRINVRGYTEIAKFIKKQKNLAEQLLSVEARSELQAYKDDVSSVFNFESQGIKDITFGLEVCLDHAMQKLAKSKDLPTIDIQLVPSCGMSIVGGSTIARVGGYIFNCDGLLSKPGDNTDCHSRVMQIQEKTEVLTRLQQEIKTLTSLDEQIGLLLGVPSDWIPELRQWTSTDPKDKQIAVVLDSGTKAYKRITVQTLISGIGTALKFKNTADAITRINNIQYAPFSYWPKVISTMALGSTSALMAEDVASPKIITITPTTTDVDKLYAKGAGELHLYAPVQLPSAALVTTKSLFPHETGFALSLEDTPILLNGMKVIFDQPVGVYPVTLESKVEERRNGNGK